MDRLLVHFDVEEDFVRLDTFIASAEATRRSINALNAELFDGKLQVEIIVFAPQPGTLKQYIGVSIRALGGVGVFLVGLSQFLDSRSVQEISKEVFGTHATEAIIEEIRERRDRAQQELKETGDVSMLSGEEVAQIAERLVVRSAEASLQVSRDTLAGSEFAGQLGHEFAEAQSELYSAALDDPHVRAIGFTEEDDFPIPRNEFAQRGVRPKPPKEEDEEDEWEVSIVQLRVTSPNFDKDDQVFRKWKAKHSGGGYYLFEVLDDEFWRKIRSREIEFTEGTDIEAQIATRMAKRDPRERRVIRVLKVDRERIASPLDDNALSAVLGKYSKVSAPKDQPGLFPDE
jgi:hypothetical protein